MNVQIVDEQDSSVDLHLLGRLAEAVLQGEGYGSGCMVDVTLVPDRRMKEMNLQHRGREGPTDVLALPLQVIDPTRSARAPRRGGPPLHLGDVVIAPGYVSRQSDVGGWNFAEEMGLMVVHGVLHLLGYRHDSDRQAVVMENRERRVLAGEGLRRR